MPALEDKPRTAEDIVRKAVGEGAVALATLLVRVARFFDTLAEELRPSQERTPESETRSVGSDDRALADLGADDLDERSWQQIRDDLGIGANRRHEAV
jgi:hypothetical protein